VATSTGTAELVRHPDDPDAVTLLVNGVPSSHLDLADPTWLEFEYMQHMAAVLDLLPPGPLDAVHLGAAACALPRRIEAVRPGSRQLAVDVDAELLRLAREWFALPRAPRLRLRAGDGRAVLHGLADASADVVLRDAFAGDATPAHLMTAEFVAQVDRVLRPGGVYLANCADRPPLALARAEVATIATALDVALVAEPGQLKGRRYGNLVVVGTRPGGPDTAGAPLARALRGLPVPATVLTGGPLRAFVAGAAPLRDAEPWVP
jgi:SAM-dependent methyltransferase